MKKTKIRMSKPVDVKTMDQIMQLSELGMKPIQISQIMGRSLTSVNTYLRCMKSAKFGTAVTINPWAYRKDIFELWCNQHGYQIPENAWENKQKYGEDNDEEDHGDDEPELVKIDAPFTALFDPNVLNALAVMMNDIAIKTHEFAEKLYDLTKEE